MKIKAIALILLAFIAAPAMAGLFRSSEIWVCEQTVTSWIDDEQYKDEKIVVIEINESLLGYDTVIYDDKFWIIGELEENKTEKYVRGQISSSISYPHEFTQLFINKYSGNGQIARSIESKSGKIKNLWITDFVNCENRT
tara:strand:+ start:338 stop:757 length:420 start_codon:yes stop_codon:yes gene_type:complete